MARPSVNTQLKAVHEAIIRMGTPVGTALTYQEWRRFIAIGCDVGTDVSVSRYTTLAVDLGLIDRHKDGNHTLITILNPDQISPPQTTAPQPQPVSDPVAA